MSAITRCRAHREPRPACLPVRRPDDALAVILTAAASPARPETICVLLDHAHRGLGVVVVEGAMADDGIFEIAEVVLRAASGRGTIGAVVLATARPGRSHLPTDDDHDRWFELRARFEAAGVELLDWFVIARGFAASLAELTDSKWLWLDAETQ